jgi:hypothetical protein
LTYSAPPLIYGFFAEINADLPARFPGKNLQRFDPPSLSCNYS